MPFRIIPGPPDRIDYDDASERDRLRIRLKNGQTIVFKVHGKSRRPACDHTATSVEMLEHLAREIQRLFRPPSRRYKLAMPTVLDVTLDMQILLPFEPYVTVGKPLVVAGVLGEKTFGLSPAYGSPVESVESYTV